ncbi:MAG: cyclic nucleotide-binding domain-containing protein [Gammaproteobacteria bacterium]|nr:cyclic nucleotide-binding domain-containing protein [Gammaproteobacteria bacterium]
MHVENQLRPVDRILQLISEMSFFNNFNPLELDRISKHLTVRDIKKDEVIFKEGDIGDCMCFVAEGLLHVHKDIEGEKDVIVSWISSGKSFGEMSILDLSPRSATVVGARESTLVILSRAHYDMVLYQHPKLGVKLLSGISRLLSLYLRQATGKLAAEISTH